jgi:hypothetical protein
VLFPTATAANTRLGPAFASRSASACGPDRDADGIADGLARKAGNADGRSRDFIRQFHGILDLCPLTSRGVIYEEQIYDGRERNGLTI